jgi:hypothetical protein
VIVVGIKGFIGSGKSTVARHLVERWGFTGIRIAAPIKEMLRSLLRHRGCPKALIDRLVDGDLKELPTPWLNGKSPRDAMEGLGEWGRERMHPDLWVNAATDSLRGSEPKRLVVEDVRLFNEEMAVRDMGGTVWEVWRPGLDPKDQPTERAQLHVRANAVIANEIGRWDRAERQIAALMHRLGVES